MERKFRWCRLYPIVFIITMVYIQLFVMLVRQGITGFWRNIYEAFDTIIRDDLGNVRFSKTQVGGKVNGRIYTSENLILWEDSEAGKIVEPKRRNLC